MKNILLISSFFLLLVSCGKKSEVETTEATHADSTLNPQHIVLTNDQYTLAGIESSSIEQRNLSNVIKMNGVIDVEPSGIASVSAPLGGFIKSAGLLPGQEIRKGQVLASLENPDFITMQEQYLENKSKLSFLEQEYKRQQTLREQDVNSAKTFQQVESDFNIVKAQLSGLEQRMELAGIDKAAVDAGKISRIGNIYAPIGGFIKSSNVNIGKYVNPTDVLFEIVNKTDLHLALNAFEKDLSKISVGQVVKFSLASENDYSRTAKVFLVGKSSTGDKVIPVHCHMTSSSSELVPGLYVKAWLETGSEKQYAVRSTSIVEMEGKSYVIVETSGQNDQHVFDFEEIRKGIEQEGYTAIESPNIEKIAQAKIVTKNAYAVLSALKNSEEEE